VESGQPTMPKLEVSPQTVYPLVKYTTSSCVSLVCSEGPRGAESLLKVGQLKEEVKQLYLRMTAHCVVIWG